MNIQRLRKAVLRATLCSALLLFLRGVAFSEQDRPASEAKQAVDGKVCDAQGAAIPGVSIHLESVAESGNGGTDAVSDAHGQYILHASPGQYSLRATKSGFRTLVVKNVALPAGGRQRIDLTLQRGDAGQAIVDYASAISPAKPAPVPPMQFSDTPNFTVAGVTDYSNVGLHGSDAKVRTSDALAKDAAALKSGSAEKGGTASGAGDLLRRLGDEKEKDGDPVGAVNEYQSAVELDPSEENYFAWGAELLLHRAGLAAIQVFSKGSTAYPKSPRMRAGLGAAYYASGQYGEAAAQMCQASDLDPANSQPYLFLGEMEKAAADPLPCSEEKLARFANQHPGSAPANFYYGLALWKRARMTQSAAGFSGAEAYFRKAAELDPQFGEAQLQLGLLYNGRGQKDAARVAFEKAVAATPGLSAARYQLSLAYRHIGDAAKADQEMKIYEELRRSEDAQLEKERRELRQFVTVSKDTKPSPQ